MGRPTGRVWGGSLSLSGQTRSPLPQPRDIPSHAYLRICWHALQPVGRLLMSTAPSPSSIRINTSLLAGLAARLRVTGMEGCCCHVNRTHSTGLGSEKSANVNIIKSIQSILLQPSQLVQLFLPTQRRSTQRILDDGWGRYQALGHALNGRMPSRASSDDAESPLAPSCL